MIDEVTNSDKVTIDICEWCGSFDIHDLENYM
jgi:hypothetical protein